MKALEELEIELSFLNKDQKDSYSFYQESNIYTLYRNGKSFVVGISLKESIAVVKALRGINTLIQVESL